MVSSYNLCFLVMWLPNDVFLTNHMLDAWGTSYLEKCNAWYMRPHGTEKPWKSCEEMKSHPIVSIWTHRGFMLEGMHAAPVLNPLEIYSWLPWANTYFALTNKKRIPYRYPIKDPHALFRQNKDIFNRNITQALKRFGAIKFMTPLHHELKKRRRPSIKPNIRTFIIMTSQRLC